MNKSTAKNFRSLTRVAQAVLIAGALLAIGPMQSARADTIYKYTGNHFSYVGTGPDVTNLSGSFTVLSALAANTTYTLTPYTAGGTITNLSFTDGRSVWNLSNYVTDPTNSKFSVITNATGNIVSWWLHIYSSSGDIQTCTAAWNCTSDGRAYDNTEQFNNYDAYNFNEPGTWTTTATTCSGTYSLSPTSQTFASTGGPGSVSVTASSGCSWTAASNVSWITITSGSSGTGSGTVAFTVAANTGTSQRTGTMTIAGLTFTVTQSAPVCAYSLSPIIQSTNSVGPLSTVKITDMSGSLSSSGAAIIVNAWDASGNALTQSASAAPIPLNNYGTTSIAGTDLIARFPTGTPMLYSFVINSPMTVVTNVKKSEDGLLNFPITFTNGLSNFAVNTVGQYSTVKITDMSGSLSSSGSAITVSAWDANGTALTQSTSATSLMLNNHGTTTIAGTDLMAQFPTGTPMTYQFAVPSSQYIFTNVKKSSDGMINVPIVFTSGTTNYCTNSVGPLSTLKITDMSGSLSSSGAAITVSAWDANGTALAQWTSAPLTLYNNRTTPILGTDLAARFQGTPAAYQIAVASSQYIITNVTGSTDGSINIPTVFTSGTNNFNSNSVDSGDTIKISDLNGSLGSSGAAITVSAWDANGNALIQSGLASSLVLHSYGTTSITGSDLAARFQGTPAAAYQFSVASPNYLITTVKSTAGGTLHIPNVVYTVQQSPPAGQLFASTGGTGTVSVTTSCSGNWTATSNVSWITITSGSSGSGNGNVNYTVLANSSSSSRTGTMTVAGQTFTVTQSPPPSCTSYSISPTSQSFDSTGGPGSVSVIASSGCSWTATSNASWITITSGSSGTGSGTVAFTVAANTGTSQRTGTMAIAGLTFTVTQSPPSSCTYSISPTSQSFVSTGGPGSVSVTASTGCSWTATSNNASWITITSASSGTGSGTVAFTVAVNTGTSQRTGTMTIAGQTFTVTQSPPSSCTYSISPTSASFDYTGGTGTVNVAASSGCSWAATSNASWITKTSASSAPGNGTVAYTVAGNSDTNQRTGTMTIAGQTFTVTESGYFIIGP